MSISTGEFRRSDSLARGNGYFGDSAIERRFPRARSGIQMREFSPPGCARTYPAGVAARPIIAGLSARRITRAVVRGWRVPTLAGVDGRSGTRWRALACTLKHFEAGTESRGAIDSKWILTQVGWYSHRDGRCVSHGGAPHMRVKPTSIKSFWQSHHSCLNAGPHSACLEYGPPLCWGRVGCRHLLRDRFSQLSISVSFDRSFVLFISKIRCRRAIVLLLLSVAVSARVS